MTEYAFTILIFSTSILILTVAAYIPYWSKTDRMWKIGVEVEDQENEEVEEKKPIEQAK